MQGGEVDVEVEHCRLVSYTLYWQTILRFSFTSMY